MDAGIEKECSALGGLFQIIMNDMKVSTGNHTSFTRRYSGDRNNAVVGFVGHIRSVAASSCSAAHPMTQAPDSEPGWQQLAQWALMSSQKSV